MNTRQNAQLGINTASQSIEALQSPKSVEKPSLLGRISKIGSGIYKKVANVLSSNTDTALPARDTQQNTGSVPTYAPVSTGELTKKDIQYADTLLDVSASKQQRQAAVLNPELNRQRKDLFAHLSEKTQQESVSNFSVPARTDQLNHTKGIPARVKPRKEPAIDYKFEYVDSTPLDQYPAPDTSGVFERKTVAKPAPRTFGPAESDWFKGSDTTAAEDINKYVKEQDSKFYAERSAAKSRGLFTNLQLWTSELKDRFKKAVAPNYYLKKEAERLEAEASMSAATRDANAYVKELDNQYYSEIAQRKARGRWNNLKAWVNYYIPKKAASGPAQPQPEPPKRPGFFQKKLRTAGAALGLAAAMGSCEGSCGGCNGCEATPGANNTPVASSSAQRKADAGNQRTKAPATTSAETSAKTINSSKNDTDTSKTVPDSTKEASKSAKTSKVPKKRYQPNPKVATTKEPARPATPMQPVKPAPRAESEQPAPAPAVVGGAEAKKQKKNQPELTAAEALLLDGIVSNMKRRVAEMKAVLPQVYGPIVLNKSNMGGSDVVVTVDSPVASNQTAVQEWIRQAEVMLKRLEGPGTVEKLDLAEATEKYILRPTGNKIAQDTEAKIAYVKDLGVNEARAAVATARKRTAENSDTPNRQTYTSYLDSVDKAVNKYAQDPYTDNLDKVRIMKNFKRNAGVAGAETLLN